MDSQKGDLESSGENLPLIVTDEEIPPIFTELLELATYEDGYQVSCQVFFIRTT